MNKNLLVSKMKLHGDRQEDLAKSIGISLQALNMKINQTTEGSQFNQGEITKIKMRYNLTSAEIDEIFFSPESSL